MIKELRKEELIVELPGGKSPTRRYVISNKGKAELERMRPGAVNEVRKQLAILAFYCDLAGDRKMSASLRELSAKV